MGCEQMISFLITLKHLISSFFHSMKDREFQGLLVLTLTTLLSGTIFYATVEGFRWVDAIYFSVTTLTTVGYGDLAPKTATTTTVDNGGVEFTTNKGTCMQDEPRQHAFS